MGLSDKIFKRIVEIIQEDKKNIIYLLYFSAVEAILVLSIPLASAFIINSLLAHSSISIIVLSVIVIVIFILTTLLQIIKEYIIEKFQQKIFVTTAIKISKMAIKLQDETDTKKDIDKYMNYFFDVTSIQKVFPVLILDGTGLIIKVIVSLLLLLAFNPYMFSFGLLALFIYIGLLFVAGRNGFKAAIDRSDAKHSSIYYLQKIPQEKKPYLKVLNEFNSYLERFVNTRVNMFKIVVKQFALTFIMEGIIISSFLIFGGYLVINGKLPIGEFVAVEIVVVSVTTALKGFVKQVDYMYDIVEGLYKVDKLSASLSEK